MITPIALFCEYHWTNPVNSVLSPRLHIWTFQQTNHHCLRIARSSFCLRDSRTRPSKTTEHSHLHHHSRHKAANLMWQFPVRICPANIPQTSVASVVFLHWIFVWFARVMVYPSQRLSWANSAKISSVRKLPFFMEAFPGRQWLPCCNSCWKPWSSAAYT